MIMMLFCQKLTEKSNQSEIKYENQTNEILRLSISIYQTFTEMKERLSIQFKSFSFPSSLSCAQKKYPQRIKLFSVD